MGDRTPCVVPGCRNSSGKFKSHYVCSTHWRMVPRWMKRRDRALYRHLVKGGRVRAHHHDNMISYYANDEHAHRLIWASWMCLERAAIRAACGL